MRRIIIIGGLFFWFSGFSQFPISNINFGLIPQKRVRNYIESQQKHDIICFTDLHASSEISDITDYYLLHKEYLIKEDISKVWETYKNVNPVKAWEGRIISFGVMYSFSNDDVVYRNYSMNGIEKGQIIYLNLRLLRGIYNLATAFKVIEVDDENKIFKFSYIEGGKARGIQTIQFLSDNNGCTRVVHTTEYQSDSRFRDKFLYGYFHKKCINQFHRNIYCGLISL